MGSELTAFETEWQREERFEQEQAALLDRNARDREQRVADLCLQMSTREGRRFVRQLLIKSGFFGSSFHPNNAEQSKLGGMRQVGAELFDDIRKHCREQYVLLEQEWMEDDR